MKRAKRAKNCETISNLGQIWVKFEQNLIILQPNLDIKFSNFVLDFLHPKPNSQITHQIYPPKPKFLIWEGGAPPKSMFSNLGSNFATPPPICFPPNGGG